MSTLAQRTGCKVYGFNYAGAGLGIVTTESSEALISDGCYLALQVVKQMPLNMPLILKGNSMGGVMVTKAAKTCYDAGYSPFLWIGRSYFATDVLFAARIRTMSKSGHYETALTRMLSWRTH